VFERFTDPARQVLFLAQEEARLLDRASVGTEHLLLGLLREGEGLAAKALGSFRVSLDATRDQVREVVGQGTASPSEHLTVTSRFKNVLQLSLREALELGANVIGTEHILLGLIREGGGVGAEVLGREGVSLPELRQRVMELISTTSGGDAPSPEPVGAGGWSAGRAHQLDDVGTNLTRLAAEDKVDRDRPGGGDRAGHSGALAADQEQPGHRG
jgi:ATP-dependent Clp protease ATP-binding subunit ClpC